jgi:hypothetical protein
MTASLLGLLLALIGLPATASPNDSPQDLMRELYRVHDQGNGPLLDPAASKERRVYFTESLAAALDQELDRRDAEEVGNLDFDPFYNAQDTEIADLDFAVAKVSGNQTFAIARFSNFGEPNEIVYKVVQDGRGWRIDDIDYGDGHTLRKVLRGD